MEKNVSTGFKRARWNRNDSGDDGDMNARQKKNEAGYNFGVVGNRYKSVWDKQDAGSGTEVGMKRTGKQRVQSQMGLVT